MDIAKEFHKRFSAPSFPETHDFELLQITNSFLIGIDTKNNPVVICMSNRPKRAPLLQKTKKLNVECNVQVTYSINGEKKTGVAHIIRCFSQDFKERDIFVELSSLFQEAAEHEDQEEAILEVVSTLSTLFADRSEPSENELTGLYAELYTIRKFQDKLNLAQYWQSKDRLKFDFSISDKLKIEVKSTTKNERKHHFRHEQLATDVYTIFVFSYMLRHDDEGLSLWDLINIVKPMFEGDPRKLLIIDRYTKNTSEERLRQLKYGENFTDDRFRIFKAQDVPKFDERAPSGVSNAEYDCSLVNIPEVSFDEFSRVIVAQLNTEKI